MRILVKERVRREGGADGGFIAGSSKQRRGEEWIRTQNESHGLHEDIYRIASLNTPHFAEEDGG